MILMLSCEAFNVQLTQYVVIAIVSITLLTLFLSLPYIAHLMPTNVLEEVLCTHTIIQSTLRAPTHLRTTLDHVYRLDVCPI